MAIVYRTSSIANVGASTIKNSPLTYEEGDGNFAYLLTNMSGSSVSIEGNTTVTGQLQVDGQLYLPQITSQSQAQVLTFNTSSGRLYFTSSTEIGRTTPPAGSNKQIQYNSASSFAAASSFTFNYDSQSFQQGNNAIAKGQYSQASGLGTVASGAYQSVKGQYNVSSSDQSAFIIGNGTSDGNRSNLFFASGSSIQMTASVAVSGGLTVNGFSVFTGSISLNGSSVTAIGGSDTQIQFNSGSALAGTGSFRFIYTSQSLQQGNLVNAKGIYSHAEGENTTASGSYSHAEGYQTIASGLYSHAEGSDTLAIGQSSHAEGDSTFAIGDYSHAAGYGTVALGTYQSTIGQFNISSSAQSAFIIGNGASTSTRSNLLFAQGSQMQISGSLFVSGAAQSGGNNNVLTYNTTTGLVTYTSSAALGAVSVIAVTGSTLYSTSPAAGPSFNTNNSIFLGDQAGSGTTNAYNANFLGINAGNNAANAFQSNFLGRYAGYQATSASNSNFIGGNAGFQADSASYSNLFGFKVGQNAGGNNIGSNNIIIGTNISLPNATANAINIGGVLFGTGTYSTIGGNPSVVPIAGGRIGIGIVSPNYTLDVSGSGNYTNGLTVTGSFIVNAPSASIVSGSASGSFITNLGDTFTSTAPVTKIVSLTSAEYSGLGTPDSNTLYIII